MTFIFPLFLLFLFINIGWEFFFFFRIFLIYFIFNYSFCSFIFNFSNFESGLIFLSIVVTLLIIIARLNYKIQGNNYNLFNFSVTSLLFILINCFRSFNFFYFYLIFEISVIPTFLLILGWGYSPERIQAGIYMFIYTFMTALPFLFFLLLIRNLKGRLIYLFYINTFIDEMLNSFWSILIRLVFMVKFPIFLLHIWLPKAHVEAPVAGSIILAGILLKLGGFGFWKAFQLFKISFLYFSGNFIFSLSLLGSIMVRLICIRQFDIKCLIAYSSVAHMGPVLRSILCFNWVGWFGAFFMMLAHGLCSSGLFYILNLTYEQYKSRRFLILKSLSIFNPILIYWWFFLCCRNMSCPPTINFISEIFLIISIISLNNFYSFLFLGILLIIRGVYSIYLYININHGRDYHYEKIFFSLNHRDFLNLLIHSFPILIFFLFVQYLYYYISLNKILNCGFKDYLYNNIHKMKNDFINNTSINNNIFTF